MEEKGMRVIELRAENYKKLLAVEIHPDPNIQVISGANAAGKSSVLDAIWAALGGSDMAKGTGTTEPIRHGQGKANVFLDLGDIRVTRKWTKSSSTLVVENKDGFTWKIERSLPKKAREVMKTCPCGERGHRVEVELKKKAVK